MPHGIRVGYAERLIEQNRTRCKKENDMLTREQAQALCDAHEVVSLLGNEEEMELLEANNPELAEAYYALHRIAYGTDGSGEVENGCNG